MAMEAKPWEASRAARYSTSFPPPPHRSRIPGNGPGPGGVHTLLHQLHSTLAFPSSHLSGPQNPPGGSRRVPVSPSSVTGILRTPGATYHLSTSTLARGTRLGKPLLWWPWYTEMVTSMGVRTLVFLNLRGDGTSAVVLLTDPVLLRAAGPPG